jgi:3-oxoacyl-[acyl-carrier protein] reductase
MSSANARTALVTGASGGIGRAVALALARDGFNVVVHYAGKSDTAEQVVAEIRKAGRSMASPRGAPERTRRLTSASV